MNGWKKMRTADRWFFVGAASALFSVFCAMVFLTLSAGFRENLEMESLFENLMFVFFALSGVGILIMMLSLGWVILSGDNAKSPSR